MNVPEQSLAKLETSALYHPVVVIVCESEKNQKRYPPVPRRLRHRAPPPPLRRAGYHARVLERVAKSQFVPGRCGCQKWTPCFNKVLKRSTPSNTLAWYTPCTAQPTALTMPKVSTQLTLPSQRDSLSQLNVPSQRNLLSQLSLPSQLYLGGARRPASGPFGRL